MKKATKGALAVTAAGALLLGGAGTLAYWNDVQSVSGSTISSGHLKLTPGTCDSWKSNGAAVDPATMKIVPGDVITRHCSYTADLLGDHLKGQVSVSTPTLTGGLAGGLTTAATYTVGNGLAVAAGTATDIQNADAIGVESR